MKRKIAAIMAADVVGYSKLVAEDEEDAIDRLLKYRQIFSKMIDKGGGRIFHTAGDAVLAEFPSAVEGLRAAIDIQRSVESWNSEVDPARQMRFRIGMTVGDVIEREGDLLGDAVNVAARLEGLAQPGGICLSKIVHDQVGNKLHIKFQDIGDQKVKNIPEPIHVFRVDLGSESAGPVAAPRPDSRGRTGRGDLRRRISTWTRNLLLGTAAIVLILVVSRLAEKGRSEGGGAAPAVKTRESAGPAAQAEARPAPAEAHPSEAPPAQTDTTAQPRQSEDRPPPLEQAAADASPPSSVPPPEPTPLSSDEDLTPVLVPTPASSVHLFGFAHTPFAVNSVSIAGDGTTLISAFGDGLIRLWNLSSGKLIRTFEGKPNDGDDAGVSAVCLSPDGTKALSAEGNKTKLWDVRSGHAIRTLGGYTTSVDAVAFFPDGQRMASVGDFSLKIRVVATGVLARDTQIEGLTRSLAISPNGKYIALGSSEGAVVYDAASGRQIRSLPLSPSGVNAVAFTSAGQALLTGGDDESIRLWDFARGRQARTFEGSNDAVVAIGTTPDGLSAVSATKSAIITVWNLQTGEAVRTIAAPSAVKALALSRYGRILVTAGEDGLLSVWRLADGTLLVTLFEADGKGAAFTPDGHFSTDAADPAAAFQLKRGKDDDDLGEYAKAHRVADLSAYIALRP